MPAVVRVRCMCMCNDGVLVDVDLAQLDSQVLRSVAEDAPGEVIPLPGVASGCLEALLSLDSLGRFFDARRGIPAADGIDLIRAAIELDCGMPVHVGKVRRHVGDTLKPLVDMDPHQETHDELRRWFDAFACAPPLYFAYALDGRIRDRLRNLLSACRSPSRAVVDSAVDFFRRMGIRPLSGPKEASEMDSLARTLIGSDAILGMEVDVAKCLVEHVRMVGVRNFWEALCEACVFRSRPADAMAIVDVCPPNMGFKDLARSLVRSLVAPEVVPEVVPEVIEHVYATKDDDTRDAIWQTALDSPSRWVLEWAVAFTGRQITASCMKPRRNGGTVGMLFDIAIHDDRCTDVQVADLLIAFKTLLTIRILELERVARMLEQQGALTSALLVALATKTNPNKHAHTAEVVAHLAASPGLRRGSDGWFEAIAYFAKRRELAAVERLLEVGKPPALTASATENGTG